MKNAIKTSAAIIVFFPWIVGFIDASWWFFMDQQLTTIKWGNDCRYCIAVTWTMFWVMIMRIVWEGD